MGVETRNSWFYEHIQFCLIRQSQYVVWEQTVRVHFPGLSDCHYKKKKQAKNEIVFQISNSSNCSCAVDGTIFSLDNFF